MLKKKKRKKKKEKRKKKKENNFSSSQFIDACLSEKDDDWWGAVSEWFSHIRGILSGAVRVVELLEASEPVLVSWICCWIALHQKCLFFYILTDSCNLNYHLLGSLQ